MYKRQEFKAPPGSKQPKLLATLYGKERYIIHYRNLRKALLHGLVLVRIHRALQFKQSHWIKRYIDLNTDMRNNAKNEFEHSLFKLMNNAVYGKCLENVRGRRNVKLVTKWGGRYGAEALISSPNFHSESIFDENLVAIQLNKTHICLNKPIYVGFSVLDISKTCVYKFHYEIIPPLVHPKKTTLLYTDTDSLIYDITETNIYEAMKNHGQYFDTSDYSPTNQFGIQLLNGKTVGIMRDELSGRILLEFVGLRSKMYSVRSVGGSDMKKCKGISSSVVNHCIEFSDYIQCLNEEKTLVRQQSRFRSRLHNIETVQQTKLALSPFDDKRVLRPNRTQTWAWGHYKTSPMCIGFDDDDGFVGEPGRIECFQIIKCSNIKAMVFSLFTPFFFLCINPTIMR